MFYLFNERNSATIRTIRLDEEVGEKAVLEKGVRNGERPYLVCEGGKYYRKRKRDWCLCCERIKKQRPSTLLMIHTQEVKDTGDVGETGHSRAKTKTRKSLALFLPGRWKCCGDLDREGV